MSAATETRARELLTFAQLDAQVAAMERRWGVDRLPRLVSQATQARFAKAQAIQRGDAPLPAGYALADVPAMLSRAWQAMEAEATAAGCQPLPDACYEIPTDDPKRGTVLIATDGAHLQALLARARAEGRVVEGWTLAEVAVLLNGQSTLLHTIKQTWPGAEVVRRAPVGRLPADPIPFPHEGAGDPPQARQTGDAA